MTYALQKNEGTELNRLYEEDQSVHSWYRFVLSFPPHLVRDYIARFQLDQSSVILDPFAGTGTTLVEAKKAGISAVGIEPNPVAYLAAKTKTNWNVDVQKIIESIEKVKTEYTKKIEQAGSSHLCLNPDEEKLIITNSLSDVPCHKAIILRDAINKVGHAHVIDVLKLAYAKVLVTEFSNLKFGPEVGVSRKKKQDVDALGVWTSQVETMIFDIEAHKNNIGVPVNVHSGDARDIFHLIENKSIDAVITSPPYPNEKDYTRTTRLESVMLGMIANRSQLKRFKQRLLRSNTRNVYKGDNDEQWISEIPNIVNLCRQIEEYRIAEGKTSGFERLYHRVVALYFGGMAKHLEELKPKLKTGAMLAYVVGDQGSYFRIPIKTGQLLSEVAINLGYEVIGIDLFRTRVATVSKQKLNEEVLILKWNG